MTHTSSAVAAGAHQAASAAHGAAQAAQHGMSAAAHGAASGMEHAAGAATQAMMMGGAMAAGAAGKGLLRTVFGNPWVALAIGAAAGWYGYKYRKEIVAAAARVRDAGQDFMLEGKERLSDIVAEAEEAEEAQTQARAKGQAAGDASAG